MGGLNLDFSLFLKISNVVIVGVGPEKYFLEGKQSGGTHSEPCVRNAHPHSIYMKLKKLQTFVPL